MSRTGGPDGPGGPWDREGPGPTGAAHLEELPTPVCRRLLGEHVAGRVGFAERGGPVILPVNYRPYGDGVVFRTSPTGVLSQLRRRTAVAFEVDGIDEAGQSGWSVLGRGFAEVVTRDHQLTQLWQSGPTPWAQGTRNLFIAVTFESLTGRRVRGPWAD
ncbi:hypothetical protein GCM10022204_32490 [Microlunatus aurantiacus]|uniref:Nitroimidazol reductase NimA, pyridoxamine 5'-phosphate oxidase superfamily n=1 Tax=Microlunatus aurantiacus TaxID=446786 RepID=A0ABP7DY21_9ACTN